MSRKRKRSRRNEEQDRKMHEQRCGYKSRPEIEAVHPKTENQRRLMEAIVDKDIIVANGAAGSGKTFVTLYQAVRMIDHGWLKKFLYIKPNVDFQGERGIGFLQGSVDDKMMPLFQPIMDNLKFCTPGKRNELIQTKKLEIGLLEYLRGRNLEDTFVLLDEAQNCSIHAVKTVISRLESGSKVVIAGDTSQCDTGDNDNGLRFCVNKLANDPSVSVINFTQRDNVRNPRFNSVLSKFP